LDISVIDLDVPRHGQDAVYDDEVLATFSSAGISGGAALA
jgi:hypothetical protein